MSFARYTGALYSGDHYISINVKFGIKRTLKVHSRMPDLAPMSDWLDIYWISDIQNLVKFAVRPIRYLAPQGRLQ